MANNDNFPKSTYDCPEDVLEYLQGERKDRDTCIRAMTYMTAVLQDSVLESFQQKTSGGNSSKGDDLREHAGDLCWKMTEIADSDPETMAVLCALLLAYTTYSVTKNANSCAALATAISAVAADMASGVHQVHFSTKH